MAGAVDPAAAGCGLVRICHVLRSRAGRGFLRALSESQFLRSKNGRVAQQPSGKGKLAAVQEGAAEQVGPDSLAPT